MPGPLSKNQTDRILNKQKHRCYYCGCRLIPQITQVDHVVPKMHGGENSIKNLVLCCRGCNALKYTYSVEEFREIMSLIWEVDFYEFYFEGFIKS